jgi:hypothetical protein
MGVSMANFRVYYTYLWLREDGTPYYVGKGFGNRAFRKGSPPRDRILIQEFPSEADSLFAEQFLIAYYGRKDLGTGILINLTDGGEGVSGFLFPLELRKQKSQSMKGKKLPLETRQKMSVALLGNQRTLGRKATPETLKRMSIAMLGKNKGKPSPKSPEMRKRLSDVQKGRIFSGESKQKMSLAAKGKPKSEEHKKKISAFLTGKVQSEVTRKKRSESMKALYARKAAERLNNV